MNYVFYYADKEPGPTAKRVEIMGAFSNWKPILMKDIQHFKKDKLDEAPPSMDGVPSTHYLRRDVDP